MVIINQRAPSRWAVSIFVGVMVARLFGSIASYPKVALWVSNAAQAELAGAVTWDQSQPLSRQRSLSDMKR